MSNILQSVRVETKVTINRQKEVMVIFSESVMKNRLKRSLVEKSPWCHIWFEIKTPLCRKPCIQKKSYYGTLSRSHGRSFRIRHKKSPETPPGEGLTMTSYSASNKTSLSRKSSRIRHEKLPEVPPGGEIMMTSYPFHNKSSLSWKPCMATKTLLWNAIR